MSLFDKYSFLCIIDGSLLWLTTKVIYMKKKPHHWSWLSASCLETYKSTILQMHSPLYKWLLGFSSRTIAISRMPLFLRTGDNNDNQLKIFNELIWQILIFVCYWWIIIMIEFEKSPKVARLADANDKVYLLLAHGRWFSLGHYGIYILFSLICFHSSWSTKL
jgi:hypothetical protein